MNLTKGSFINISAIESAWWKNINIPNFDGLEMIEGYIEELREVLTKIDRSLIEKLSNKIIEVGERGGSVYIVGNGGSAVNASHMACDLSKGTLKRYYHPEQKRLRVISLTDNVATITALANDLTYDEVFSQQLRNLVRPGDLVIAITGSGNSRNILNAADVARKSGAHVFSLVGFDGGELAAMSDDCLIIPSKNYGIIEDVHLAISHMLTISIKKENNFVK